jgi:hypothetical protein
MTVLSELIEHHVKEEEKEMFKIARKLGKDQLEEIGEEMGGMLGEAGMESEEEEDAAREMAGGGRRSRRDGR